MKRFYFIVFLLLTLFFVPDLVFAKSYSGNAGAGRSAVMDTSLNYYYTDWKTLSTNSLNVLPVPYSGGNYYLMGSEYAFAVSMEGDTYFSGHVTIPVAANTIYNYTLTNGLNSNDMRFGIDHNFAVYNVNATITNSTWWCEVYPHLGVAHTYCYYDIYFNFSLPEALSGAYNLNVAVLNLSSNRSAYYYSGTDSNGCAIEFPMAAANSGYPDMRAYMTMTSSGGQSGSPDNTEEILEGVSQAADSINETILESYENLVKSQEVCSNINILTSTHIGGNNNLYMFFNDTTQYGYVFKPGTYTLKYDGSNSNISLYSRLTLNGSNTRISYLTGDDISFTINSDSYLWLYSNVGFSSISNLSLITNVCQNGNQATFDYMTEPFDSGIGATLFEGVDWYENSHFSSIITAPISFLNSLNDACTPITLTYRGQDIVLPCGTTIFWDKDNGYISNFRLVWNILFAGLIIYRLALKLIMTINDCLDPTKDKIGGFDI